MTPTCKISNIANGVLIEIENSRTGSNGVWFHKTIQSALVQMWDELYPNSASSTLQYIKEQLSNLKRNRSNDTE